MTKKALKNKVEKLVVTKMKKGKVAPSQSPVDEAMKAASIAITGEDVTETHPEPSPDLQPESFDLQPESFDAAETKAIEVAFQPPQPEPVTVVQAQTPRSELTITDEWSDVQGQKEDLEKEAKAAATAYRDRIKTLESKISDLHDEYVNACCDEVIDYKEGVANYVHRRTGKIVRTRPLAGDDRQAELPFGKLTPPPVDMKVTRDGHPYVVVKADADGVTLEDQEDPSQVLCLTLEDYYK